MPSLNMKGPFDFEEMTIDLHVTRTSAGNYALGHVNAKGFVPKYVGRADEDVYKRIKDHLGEDYTKFMFSYAPDVKAAFEKECENYHAFSAQLNNEIHPDRPAGKKYECPFCDTFD